MRALSIKQPWASGIARGAKTIEVRSWTTAHRGELLVCSSLAPVQPAMANMIEDGVFAEFGETWDRGAMICVVNLVDVRPLRKSDRRGACFDIESVEGLYAWVLESPRAVVRSPIKGKLSLFNVDDGEVVFASKRGKGRKATKA